MATSLLLLNLTIISCSSNDGGEPIDDGMNMTDDDGGTNLETAREETNTILTGNASKTWKIESALLRNDQGEFTITENFNVQDDEFVFSGDVGSGMLEWRPGNDINLGATDANGTLLDYYLAPESYSFSFTEESSDMLTSIDGQFAFTVVDDTTLTGTITFSGRSNAAGEELVLTLGEKTAEDYITPPENGLIFSEVFTFESDGVSCCAPGMIGSYSDNSLFVVTREDALNDGNENPERIIKFDLETNSVTENLFFNGDFVSKQLHIINNQLVVIGGQYVNTYNLDFAGNPTSTLHGLSLTRFGMSVQGDDAFIVGGDLNTDPNTGEYLDPEKIYKWNIPNQSLSFVADLPEGRYGARSAVVNDKLYVFGGVVQWLVSEAQNTIYIYDTETGAIEEQQMTSVAEYTYVDKFQNLIYVGSRTDIDDPNGDFVSRDFFLGSFNTENNTYQEISTNLPTDDPFNAIHGLCVFNNKIYVLFGAFGEENGGELKTWRIFSADL